MYLRPRKFPFKHASQLTPVNKKKIQEKIILHCYNDTDLSLSSPNNNQKEIQPKSFYVADENKAALNIFLFLKRQQSPELKVKVK